MRSEKILSFGPVTGMRVGGSLIGKPLMTVIYYYVDNLLIDTGSYRTRKSISKFTETNRIDYVALTHYHEDHAGNAGFLARKLDVPIYGNEHTINALKKRVPLKAYEYFIFGPLEAAPISLCPDNIETENYNFKPIHTPGHSWDHTIYFEKNQGWVFSGDLFLGSRIKFWRKDEDILATIESLKLVLSLDFEYLFCGHNPKMIDPKKSIRLKLSQLTSLLDKVRILLNEGRTKKDIIVRLCRSKEAVVERLVTFGDVSYKNMVVAAIDAVNSQSKASVVNSLGEEAPER